MFAFQVTPVTPVTARDLLPLIPNTAGASPEDQRVIVYDKNFQDSASSSCEDIELSTIQQPNDSFEDGFKNDFSTSFGDSRKDEPRNPFIDVTSDSYENDFSTNFENDFSNNYNEALNINDIEAQLTSNPNQQPFNHAKSHPRSNLHSHNPQPQIRCLTLHIQRNSTTSSTISLLDPTTQTPIYQIHDTERPYFSRTHDLEITRMIPYPTPMGTIRFGTTHTTLTSLESNIVQTVRNSKLSTFTFNDPCALSPIPVSAHQRTPPILSLPLATNDAQSKTQHWHWSAHRQTRAPKWLPHPSYPDAFQLHIRSPLLTMTLSPSSSSSPPLSSADPTQTQTQTQPPLCTIKLYTARPIGTLTLNLPFNLSTTLSPKSAQTHLQQQHQQRQRSPVSEIVDWSPLDPILLPTLANLEYQRRQIMYGSTNVLVTLLLAVGSVVVIVVCWGAECGWGGMGRVRY